MTEEQKFNARQQRASNARARQLPEVIATNAEEAALLVGRLGNHAWEPVREAGERAARYIKPVAAGAVAGVATVAVIEGVSRHMAAKRAAKEREQNARVANPGDTWPELAARTRAETAEYFAVVEAEKAAIRAKVDRAKAKAAREAAARLKAREREVKERKREAEARAAEIQARIDALQAREAKAWQAAERAKAPPVAVPRKPARSSHGNR